MPLQTQDLTLDDAGFPGLHVHLVAPAGVADAPGIVLVAEPVGPDPIGHVRPVARRYAEAGYRVLIPDLLEQDIPPEALSEGISALRKLSPTDLAVPARVDEAMQHVEPRWRKPVQEFMAALFRGATPEGLEAVSACCRWLRAHGARKVAVTGFCFGGGYTWAFAFHGGEADAFVPFYGRLPQDADPAKVRGAVLAHLGGTDQGIPPAPIEEMAAKLRERGIEATVHVYEGAPHAFFNPTRDTYVKEAADLAWERTIAFLDRNLKGTPATSGRQSMGSTGFEPVTFSV